MTEQPQVRVRVNVGRTSKGVPSYDCTVEVIAARDFTTEQLEVMSNNVLAESDRVEAILKDKYGSEWQPDKPKPENGS